MQFLIQSTSSKNKKHFWGKILILICILAFVFYMYYRQYLIEPSYNWKWLSNDNLTIVPAVHTTVNDNAIDNTTADMIVEGNNVDIISSQADKIVPDQTKILQSVNDITTTTVNHEEDLKVRTILQWSPGRNSPFYHMGKGHTNFIKLSCPFVNCYVTDYKRHFKNFTEFDAIIFNSNFVIYNDEKDLPQYRSLEQIYVFGATESAHNNPACKPVLDNFFNWTYTYRLDSDVRWSYIIIYDENGTEVGPKPNMVWPDEMDPIDEETQAILDGKSKTAAWFVSHCNTLSKREDFAKEVQQELKRIDNRMSVDIYGRCGSFTCPRRRADKCYDLLKRDYYFYFSFENSFAVDYVTEKLLTALNNFAVPVVFGGADYSRYLPPGSYLNARELGPEKLATNMKQIIDNRTRYHDFFRWRNHFKYKQGENDSEICNICTALNNPREVRTTNLYPNFRDWWYPDYKNHDKCK